MLGSCCLVDDLDAVVQANDLCNRLGIDVISTGAFVAFTMECFERGLVTPAQLGGWEARWGSGEFLVHLVGEIGRREGFGELFARGIRPAARALGREAEALAVEVKGLDLPGHDPRSFFSLAINYATGTRGACHLRGFPEDGEAGLTIPEIGLEQLPQRFSMDGQASLTKIFQDYAAVLDSLVCCLAMQELGQSLQETTDLLNAITG
jgi:aldehyde:ferredoxin oxidoreductase